MNSLINGSPRRYGSAGYLSRGIHTMGFAELASLTAFNEVRQGMWDQFASFIAWPIRTGRFNHAYVGGSFLSREPSPLDIDVILETKDSYGPAAFAAVSPFFSMGLQKINRLHRVHLHFWIENAPGMMNDFRTFFQYGRNEAQPSVMQRHGIARLSISDSAVLDATIFLSNKAAAKQPG